MLLPLLMNLSMLGSTAAAAASDTHDGGGWIARSDDDRKRRHAPRNKRELEGLWDQLYVAMYGLEMLTEKREALAEVVAPFVQEAPEQRTDSALVAEPGINWSALKADYEAMTSIIALYQIALAEQEDEDDVLVLTMI